MSFHNPFYLVKVNNVQFSVKLVGFFFLMQVLTKSVFKSFKNTFKATYQSNLDEIKTKLVINTESCLKENFARKDD